MNPEERYPISTMAGEAAKARRADVTLRQNLDDQIAHAEKVLSNLHEAKARLEASGILDARIDDIQQAMRW